ncbi:MAG TPA: SH3 domain-containing protein [Chloroflexota bacterium]|nr:SH3 domain-containing protein [Chloroflexota bacterium]
MPSTPSLPGSARLRYSAAPVLDRADLGARIITQLYRGDAFTVLGREGQFCQVQLANGATGFVLGNNLSLENDLSMVELREPFSAMAEQPGDGERDTGGAGPSPVAAGSRQTRRRGRASGPRNG